MPDTAAPFRGGAGTTRMRSRGTYRHGSRDAEAACGHRCSGLLVLHPRSHHSTRGRDADTVSQGPDGTDFDHKRIGILAFTEYSTFKRVSMV